MAETPKVETTFQPHPFVHARFNIDRVGRHGTHVRMPAMANHAFTGRKITIHATTVANIMDVGPADGLGFAKSGLTFVAEALFYKWLQEAAARHSSASVEIVDRSRKNYGDDKSRKKVTRSNIFVSGKKIINLDSAIIHQLEFRPTSSGITQIDVFVEGYQLHFWDHNSWNRDN